MTGMESGETIRSNAKSFSPLILPLILLISAMARLAFLGDSSIYVDEAASLYVADRPLSGIVPLMLQIREVHPPFHHWLLNLTVIPPARFLSGFYGNQLFWLRAVSALFGVVSVYITYLLALRFFSERTALISAFFLGISSFHIYYSRELRMYPLLLILLLAGFYFFLKILEKPNPFNIVPYILITGASLLTHYFAFFAFVIEGLFCVYLFIYGKENGSLRRNMLSAFICALISLLFFLPWVSILIGQTGAQDFGLRSRPDIHSLFTTIFQIAFGFTFPVNLYRILHLPLSILPLGLILRFFLINRERGKAFFSIYLLVPIVFCFGITLLTRINIFEYKYFYIISPALWIMVSATLTEMRSKNLKTAVFFILSAVNIFSIFCLYTGPAYYSQNWEGAVKAIRNSNSAGVKVLVHPSMMAMPFFFHHGGKVFPVDFPGEEKRADLASDEPFLLVTVPNHPFLAKAGLVKYLKGRFHCLRVWESQSARPADVIRVEYYFVPEDR